MTTEPAAPVVRALEQQRLSFSSLKALARLEIVKHGRKRTYDSVGIVVDGQRRLRIEAYGPMGQSLMALVWNGREVLLRMPGKDGMMQTGAKGLQQLLGKGLDVRELCAVLSGTVPSYAEMGGAVLLCGPKGVCLLELRNGELLRKIGLSIPAPDTGRKPRMVSAELLKSDSILYRVRYEKTAEISGYRLPTDIVIEEPDKDLRLTVQYDDADVNIPIDDGLFTLPGGLGSIGR